MTETTREPFRVLAGAAGDYIKRHGWTQDVLGVGAKRCAVGAISECSPDQRFEVGTVLVGHMRSLLGCDVAVWNDEPDRTKGEVVQLLYAISDGAI